MMVRQKQSSRPLSPVASKFSSGANGQHIIKRSNKTLSSAPPTMGDGKLHNFNIDKLIQNQRNPITFEPKPPNDHLSTTEPTVTATVWRQWILQYRIESITISVKQETTTRNPWGRRNGRSNWHLRRAEPAKTERQSNPRYRRTRLC